MSDEGCKDIVPLNNFCEHTHKIKGGVNFNCNVCEKLSLKLNGNFSAIDDNQSLFCDKIFKE